MKIRNIMEHRKKLKEFEATKDQIGVMKTIIIECIKDKPLIGNRHVERIVENSVPKK